MSARTFVVRRDPMRGDDVRGFQAELNRLMRHWGVDYRLEEDGVWGAVSRDLTASALYGLGVADVGHAMRGGVTPGLRVKVRHRRRSAAERARAVARRPWLARFRARHRRRLVAPPLAKVLSHSWGYHPGVHDGVDLICPPRSPGLAICRARVLRADDSGWWGKGAPADPAVRSRGDGIVVLECLVDSGPFRRGLRFCYGHAEHVRVRPGEVVEAGQVICEAGLANAWHFHFMVNGRSDAKGVGDRDPMPYLRHAGVR